MADSISGIHDYEIRRLVNRLVDFLGQKEVEKSLHKYQQSLKSASPVFRDYYLKTRHPWWSALTRYFELKKKGKSIQKNLTIELKVLAGDAKQVTTLQRLMPESVRQKYRKDLIDEQRAYDYLFEIHVAWHFYLKGCTIKWHEDNYRHHSEFLLKTPDFEFNVECKRISVDAFKAIRRRDFYRLAEKLIPEVEKQHYAGMIDIVLKDRLHSNDEYLADLICQITGIIRSGNVEGHFQFPTGNVSLDLRTATDNQVDLHDLLREMWKRKSPQAHGAIFVKAKNSKGVNPIEMTLMSERADRVLNGISEKICEASNQQLDNSIPGLIVCFLAGVDDLSELASGSGLQIMTNHLFERAGLSHLAAVSYCAEPRVERLRDAETFSNQGLIFRNANCRFEKARDYQFLSGEKDST